SFPPNPFDSVLRDKILTKACKRLSPNAFQESGCAVCGELHPFTALSKLKSVKNMLHVLSSPGMTRVARKNGKDPVKEFSGPVLDYSCSHICDTCRRAVREGKTPRLALAHGLWIGAVPVTL
ncbi:hypothetical protein BJ165DRAFT_1322928, partial [Panaeolus papilionaceus]